MSTGEFLRAKSKEVLFESEGRGGKEGTNGDWVMFYSCVCCSVEGGIVY